LWDAELQRPEASVEGAVAAAVAPGVALAAALVAPSADQPLDIALHQQLQHRFCHGSQKIAFWPSPAARPAPISFRHRSSRAAGRSRRLARWPPQLHRSPTLRTDTRKSTTSGVANQIQETNATHLHREAMAWPIAPQLT